jgi:hypothetical protein
LTYSFKSQLRVKLAFVNPLKRIRGFLLLDQRAVERATGVPVYRLAKAEQGLLTLNDAEQRVLRRFYQARWKMAMEECTEEFTLDS